MSNLFPFMAFIIGIVITISLLNYFISLRIKGRFAADEIPASINLLKAVYFICGGFVLSEINAPLRDLNTVLVSGKSQELAIFNQAMYFSIFLGIALLYIIIIIWFSSMVYAVVARSTSVINDAVLGKISHLVLFAGISLSFTITLKGALNPIVSWLIPYPDTPLFH